MKSGSNDFDSFETPIYKIANIIDMLETNIMHLFNKNELCKCKHVFDNTDNKTCDICINHIGSKLICEWCIGEYTRTNRTMHMKSFKCKSNNSSLCFFSYW